MSMAARLLAALSLSMIGTVAVALPVMVDFQSSGAPTETGFTGVSSSPSTVGGVTFTFTGALFDRNPGAVDSGAFTYADLYNDFAYTNASGGSTTAPVITLALAGLAANTSYDLRFYSSDFFGGGTWATSVQTTYTATVGSGSAISSTFDRTSNPTSNQQNSVLGSFLSNSSGNLTFQIQGSSIGGGQAFTRLNGLELSATALPAAIPEPASLWLAGVALLGMGVTARRRRAA